MANILLIYNYQREIPPFMLPQIEEAVKRYDEVYYTSPSLSNKAAAGRHANLHFLTWGGRVRLRQYAKGLTCIMRPRFWRKLKELGLTRYNMECLGQDYFCIEGIEAVANPVIEKALKRGDKVTVMAAWFNLCAVAAARVKERHPEVSAESFAHAFEIDALRGSYCYRAWAERKHSVLDQVHFISRVKMENYFRSLDGQRIQERFGGQSCVSYLGSHNHGGALNPTNDESASLHIVTCSRTAIEKRLTLLAEALSHWTGSRHVRWTHLGDGPLQGELRQATERLMTANSKVTAELTGGKPNAEIHAYYASEPIDLFINVSDTEGLPVSIMEASSYGIPCAATNVGGTGELVDSSMGWLIDADFSPGELCRQIEAFVAKPVQERNAMRENAHRIWQEKFNAEVTIPALWDSVERRAQGHKYEEFNNNIARV